jgi:hypothetical protein
VSAKFINKKIIKNEDIVPYLYEFPANFRIANSKNHIIKKGEKKFSNCIGSGVAREVYVHPENKDLVIKINKKIVTSNSSNRNKNQSENEIFAFLNLEPIRKWMPQIYNYDSDNFSWIIAERCNTDPALIASVINSANLERANLILQTIEPDSMDEKSILKLFLPIRKRIDITISKCKKNSLFYDLFKYNNLDLNNHKEVYKKFKSSNEKSSSKKVNFYLDWATLITPMIADFTTLALKHGVFAKDLHDKNLGISNNFQGENSLRIIDLGIIH